MSNVRTRPDQVLVDIADYVLELQDRQRARLRHRAQLPDRHAGLRPGGAGISGLHQAAGPDRPGTVVPNGAKVPGTQFQLDPVQAAFNIGTMIRWLDFNDTWLAAEWGHPSDNLGGILAVADWLSRNAVAAGKHAAHDARRADRHDQGARDPGRASRWRTRFNKVGLDHVVLVKVASTAVVAQHARPVARRRSSMRCRSPGSTARPAHLSPRAQHRLAQELGGGRRHQPRRCAWR